MSRLRKFTFSVFILIVLLTLSEAALWMISQAQVQLRQQSQTTRGQQLVTLGDSVTQGGYPKPLKALLPSWSIQDLAASGRGIDYVVDTLHEHGSKWLHQNTLLLIMIGHNDCMYLQSFAQQHHIADSDDIITRSKRFFRYFRSFRVLVQIVTRLRPTPAPTLVREPPPRLGSTQELRYCQQSIDTGLAEINDWSQKNGHALSLLTYPIPHDLSPQDRRPDHLLQVNRLVNQLLIQTAKKYDIHWIDTATCMADQPRSLWETDAVHLTNEGDKAFANCLFPMLSLDRL